MSPCHLCYHKYLEINWAISSPGRKKPAKKKKENIQPIQQRRYFQNMREHTSTGIKICTALSVYRQRTARFVFSGRKPVGWQHKEKDKTSLMTSVFVFKEFIDKRTVKAWR